jgi:IS5 family transposase
MRFRRSAAPAVDHAAVRPNCMPTKGYEGAAKRRALRARGILPRIARRGVESRDRLGRHRWVVERTLSWLNRKRRLKIRYERRADVHLAFLVLGCALICWNFIQGGFC